MVEMMAEGIVEIWFQFLDAKTQMGADVTISGIVSTPDYGANNGQYYVQDETGGINIIHFSNNGLVAIGDEVRN